MRGAFVSEGDLTTPRNGGGEAEGSDSAERRRLIALFEQSPGFLCFLREPERVVELANDAFHQIVGHRPVIGRSLRETMPELGEQGFFSLMDQVVRTGEPYVGRGARVLFQHSPGAPFEEAWVDFVYQPIRDDSGRVNGILVQGHDVTEAHRAELRRVAAEEARRASEERYRRLFESLEDGYCTLEMIFDEAGEPVDYRFLETNTAFEAHTGLKNAVGRRVRELVPNLDESWFRLYGRVAMTGEPARFENHAPAMHRWFEVSAFRIDDPSLRRVALLFKDITVRRETGAALQRSEERYMLASRATRDAIWDWDLGNHEVRWTLGVHGLFGHPAEETLTTSAWWKDHVHPDDRARVVETIQAVIDSPEGEHWEAAYRFRRFDGTYADVVDRGFVVRDPQTGIATRMVGAMRDVTSERAAQVALGESEARLQAILDAAPSVVFVKDLEGRFVFVNRATAKIYGRPREEILGKRDDELLPASDVAPWLAHDRQVLETGQPQTFEERNGERQFLSVKFPLRTLEGELYAICGISSDVSELRGVERERERLAGVQEQMVSIVSHDVRSPLAALLMSAQALKRQPLEPNLRRAAERIERSARRVEQVVRLMLDFTRSRLGVPIPIERREVDLQEIARGVAEELQSADPARKVALAGGPAVGQGDPDRLYQVLANLMENAFKYGERGAPVTVTTGAEDGWLVLSVHNRGPAIPPELQARMFAPFTRGPQTAETVKISMGLGLSIVDQLVKAHGGSVTLRSLPEEGTTFTVRLPRGG